MTADAVPTVIAGRYEIGELLGRGGMAEVYAGVDRRLARPVAIKLLDSRMAARPEIRARFETEAQTAARLTHPAAVAVYDTGDHHGVPYIVMERLPGETLADRIAAGPVDPMWLQPVAVEILGALAAAHSAGMVHRDIKPANILLTADGHAKIADFGIAKSLEEPAAGMADLTGTGQLLGTPAYLAPERLQGAPATACSDIYSMGVVLYEALAGSKPFTGGTPLEVAQRAVAGDHPSLASMRPDVDPSFAAAVEKAMARLPDDRYASAVQMSAGLARPPGDPTLESLPAGDDTMILESDGTPAAGLVPEMGERHARPVPFAGRRRPPLAWLAVVAALALVGMVLLGTTGDGTRVDTGPDSGPGIGEEGEAPAPLSPAAALAREMRDRAGALSPSDGARYADLAERLRNVAGAVEAGTGGPAASALIFEVAQWSRSGEISPVTAASVLTLLSRVPGATVAPLAAPTTVAVPVVPNSDRNDLVDNDSDGDGGKGRKSRGKGD